MIDLLRALVVGRVVRLLGALVLGTLVVGVGYTLVLGTDALVALGLPRQLAGSTVTVAVVAGCLYGLYWFATRMIDW